MANYFRITAYHPSKNICAIFDSNGRFEKLWQFSSHLVQKGFQILAVGNESKFTEGNIPKAEESDKILVRACIKGKPLQCSSRIEVGCKSYEVI